MGDRQRSGGWLSDHVTLIALAVVGIGCGLRLYHTMGAYLNPDEAQHFLYANTGDFVDTYLRSLHTAHPPLLLLVLNATLRAGDSELAMRLPSLLTGTAALWLAFRWLQRSAGDAAAVAGLIFLSAAPGMISVATEVRQYGCLLVGICGALYCMERFITERSTAWVAAFALSLYVAILSHYTAAWVTLTLGLYVSLRLWSERPPRLIVLSWLLSQTGAAALYWLFYTTHLHAVRGGGMEGIAITGWLKSSYYRPGEQTVIDFILGATSSAVQHLAGGMIPGAIVGGLFVFGVAAIATRWPRVDPQVRRDYAVLLTLPVIIGCAAAVDRLLPFGGTRHVNYLLPFIAGGVGVAVARIFAARTMAVLAVSAILGTLWIANTTPTNNVAQMDRASMSAALAYLDDAVPGDSFVLVDGKTHFVLLYYLRGGEKGLRLRGAAALNETQLHGLRIVSFPSSWAFEPGQFAGAVHGAIEALQLAPGQPLWVMSVGWMRDEDLEKELPPSAVLLARRFGRITLLKTAAGYVGS